MTTVRTTRCRMLASTAATTALFWGSLAGMAVATGSEGSSCSPDESEHEGQRSGTSETGRSDGRLGGTGHSRAGASGTGGAAASTGVGVTDRTSGVVNRGSTEAGGAMGGGTRSGAGATGASDPASTRGSTTGTATRVPGPAASGGTPVPAVVAAGEEGALMDGTTTSPAPWLLAGGGLVVMAAGIVRRSRTWAGARSEGRRPSSRRG